MTDASRGQLQSALKLALSVTLFYWLALALRFPGPKNGIIAIAVISLAAVGESYHKGVLRLVGTIGGAAVGLAILEGFGQSRWGLMTAMAMWLIFVAYNIQSTRHGYAWFLGVLTAILVWTSSYKKLDHAFDAALWRIVETGAGILVYTLVHELLWPVRAGPRLKQAGRGVVAAAAEQFELCRRELQDGERPADAAAVQAAMAGKLPALKKILPAAIADTPDVRVRANAWRSFESQGAALGQALQLFEVSAGDVRELDVARLVPDLNASLDVIGARFERARSLSDSAHGDDRELLTPLTVHARETASLAHAQRARLMNFLHRTRILDEASRALLGTVRALAGLKSDVAPPAPPREESRTPSWDPERFVAALTPATFFVAGYLFWIFLNPPAGPALTLLCAVFGLLVSFIPMNLFKILKLLLLGIAASAPVYMFVLPRLENAEALLALIFIATFLLGLLGGKLAPLKMIGLILFAVITGIKSKTSYNFLAVLYPAVMMTLGTCIVMAVYWFFTPMQPEKVAIRSVRRFFRGCARVMQGFNDATRNGWWLRRRAFRSDVLAANQRLGMVAGSLDDADNTPEKVARLQGALQATVYRLQALEDAFERIDDTGPDLPIRSNSLGAARAAIERVFRAWSGSPDSRAMDAETAEFERLARQVNDDLDQLIESDEYDEEVLQDFWAVLGCMKGLIDGTKEAQAALAGIHWQRWAVVRF